MKTKRLAQAIKGIRLGAGLSRVDLANRTRLHIQTIYKLECGNSKDVKAGTLIRVGRALGKDPRDLFALLVTDKPGPV